MQDGDIASVEPLVGIDRVFLGLEIAFDHPRPANLQTAGTFAIARQNVAGLIHRPQLHPERRAALLAHHVDLLVERQVIPIRRWRAHRANR